MVKEKCSKSGCGQGKTVRVGVVKENAACVGVF